MEKGTMVGKHAAEFKLSITKALGDQLALALETLTPIPLTPDALGALDASPGVYQLYLGGALVYVGKADRSLPQRLEKHLRKLSSRSGMDIADVTFSCLYVEEDFSAVAPERLLISRHKGLGEVPWNYNGFGNNDPGKRRDRTLVEGDHFDRLFPIDLDWTLPGIPQGRSSLAQLLVWTKGALPYLFRYQDSPSFADIVVEVPTGTGDADQLLAVISGALPDGWRITALPGYVIMYPEEGDYPSALRYYQAGQSVEPRSLRVSRADG
ncbi:Eco29kI family restriction endonuclease [Streptomyces sp. NPDC050535]|uniref:Eco29kI family restriction endonuclease n=1 Tax=Streptomyces sp. NPDC050535 TaxID=3365626 RepID=UPI0037A96196